MNREEIGHLLTKAAVIDNRTVTPVLIQSWHELLHDLDYTDAMAALAYHRIHSTEYLVPAHIAAGVRRIRAERIERSITAPPPAELSDDARAAQRWLQHQLKAIADGKTVNRALGGPPPGQRRPGPPPEVFQLTRDAMNPDDDTDAAVRRAALQVACPHCAARPGAACTLSGTRSPLLGRPAHDARIEAAAQA